MELIGFKVTVKAIKYKTAHGFSLADTFEQVGTNKMTLLAYLHSYAHSYACMQAT